MLAFLSVSNDSNRFVLLLRPTNLNYYVLQNVYMCVT